MNPLLMTPSEYEDALTRGDVDPTITLDGVELTTPTPRLFMARGFGDWLCKIWQAVLKLVDSIVDTAVSVVNTLGKAAIQLLSDVVGIAADGISSLFGSTGGKLLLLAGGGVLLWWMFGRDKDEKEPQYNAPLPRLDPIRAEGTL